MYIYRLQIESSKAVNNLAELKTKFAKLEKDFKKSETDHKNASTKCQELNAMYAESDTARIAAEKENHVCLKRIICRFYYCNYDIYQIKINNINFIDLGYEAGTCSIQEANRVTPSTIGR